jgi:hypothetical protein
MIHLRLLTIFAIVSLAASLTLQDETCRFAKLYRTQDLLTDPEQLDSFLRTFMRW